MPENEVKVIFSGDARKLERTINRTGKHMKSFGRKTVNTFKRVGKSIGGIGRRLKGIGPMLGIAGLGMAAKGVVDFDAKLARLRIAGDLTRKQTMELRKEILKTAKETNQMPSALLESLDAIVLRTGNLKYALSIMKDMGVVSTATGADMKEVGAIASNLNEKMLIPKEKIFGMFDVLNLQGKEGSFEFRAMATYFEKLLSAATMVNIKGEEGVRKYGALLQVAQRGTGDPARTATSVEALISEMMDKVKSKKIKGITGMSVAEDGFFNVLYELVRKADGDVKKLATIFERESIRTVNQIAQSYKANNNSFAELVKLAEVGGSGKTIRKDRDVWMETPAAKAKDLVIEADVLLKINLEKSINEAAKIPDITRDYYKKIKKDLKETTWEDYFNPIPALQGFSKAIDIWDFWNPIKPYPQYIPRSAAESSTKQPTIVNNNINIHIDENDRVIAESDNMNTTNKVELERGILWPKN